MSQFFSIHPSDPQPHLVKEAVRILQDRGVVIYPTDSTYAIGCKIADKSALDRIRMIRQLDDKHNFTLVCRDLSELANYAYVDNPTFRLLKAHIPGPYTFILPATKEVPKRLMHPKRNTIGLRVPDCKILQTILEELNEPLMSATLVLPDHEFPFVDARDIYDELGSQVDLVIDGGPCSLTPTSVIDLVEGAPKIVRVGKGDVTNFK